MLKFIRFLALALLYLSTCVQDTSGSDTWIASDVTKWINLLFTDAQHSAALEELQNVVNEGTPLFYSSDASSLSEMKNAMKNVSEILRNSTEISVISQKVILSVKFTNGKFWNQDASIDFPNSEIFSFFIFNLDDPPNCNGVPSGKALASKARKTFTKKISIGISFSPDLFKKCKPYILDYQQNLQLFLVKVRFSTGAGFPFHYDIFRMHMKELEKNSSFPTLPNPTYKVNGPSKSLPIVVYHLKLDVPTNLSHQKGDKYQDILVQHAVLYVNSTTSQTDTGPKVILESKKGYFDKKEKAAVFSSTVIPYMEQVQNENASQQLLVNYQLPQISEFFSNLVISFDDWLHMLNCSNSGDSLDCNSSSTPTFTKTPKLLIEFTSTAQVSLLIKNITFFQKWFGQPIDTLIFREDVKVDSVILRQCSSHVKIGYRLLFGSLQEITENWVVERDPKLPTHHLEKPAPILIWEFTVNIAVEKKLETSDKFHKYFVNEFYLPLENIRKMRDDYIDKNRNATIIIKINGSVPHLMRQTFQQSLYCKESEAIIKMNMMYEAIFNWAQVNDFIVILKAAIQTEETTSPGWLYEVKVPSELEKVQGQVLTIRGYHNSFNNYFKSDPCLSTIVKIPQTGIHLSNHFGASIDMECWNKSLTVNELYVMAQFAFSQFQNVEVLIGKDMYGDSDNLVKVLKAPFDKSIIKNVFLRLELPKPTEAGSFKTFLALNVDILKRPAFPLEGIIYLSNWEPFKTNHLQLEKVINFISYINFQSNVSSGLGVRDCPAELNFFAEENLQNSVQIDYIICTANAPLSGDQNKTTMTHFFDEHLVLQKMLNKIWPRAKLVIRISHTYGAADVEKYLMMINDVSQFASTSHIFYFIQAFGSSVKGEIGWWGVDKSQRFSDPSCYVEVQSKHHNKPSWRPPLSKIWNTSETKPNPSTEWSTLTIVVITIAVLLSVMFLLLFIGVAVYLGRKLRNSQRLLTNKEVTEFFNGSDVSSTEVGNSQENKKFVQEYSIPKSEFHLDTGKIIGLGNFGTVYKAIVKDKLAAVKVPNTATSKVSYKTMLMEVKILCYVGIHPNVVEFIGSYVAEVGTGVIYIATVFCENGSLEGYLRRKPRDGQVDDKELTQFAVEVATGMDYITKKRIIHGDLSTRNVLLDGDNVCKIADFGLSRKLYDYTQYVKKSQEPLPWRWLAHESLTKMEFSSKSDVWSFGVTLWEIFNLGDVPYAGLSWSVDFADRLNGGLRLSKPSYTTDAIFERMKECWKLEPELRPDFQNLMRFLREEDYTRLY